MEIKYYIKLIWLNKFYLSLQSINYGSLSKYLKIFKKDLYEKRVNSALSEVQRGPKKLTFIRAIITSVISMLITLAVCYGLFMIGTLLSNKVITMF